MDISDSCPLYSVVFLNKIMGSKPLFFFIQKEPSPPGLRLKTISNILDQTLNWARWRKWNLIFQGWELFTNISSFSKWVKNHNQKKQLNLHVPVTWAPFLRTWISCVMEDRCSSLHYTNKRDLKIKGFIQGHTTHQEQDQPQNHVILTFYLAESYLVLYSHEFHACSMSL